MDEQAVWSATIYNVVHGSRCYGTHTPESDFDEKGICVVPDPSYYFGFKRFEQKDSGWADGADRTIYDVRKFFKLALACNPNIIEILFVDDKHILKETTAGWTIRIFRNHFLSRRAARTFSGYAHSQMHKLERKLAKDGIIKWKHASHLLRLCRMGEEILRDGEVKVLRPDAEYLKRIRRGEIPLDEILNEAADTLNRLSGLAEKSPLPEKPDDAAAERLLVNIVSEVVNA